MECWWIARVLLLEDLINSRTVLWRRMILLDTFLRSLLMQRGTM